MRCPRCDAEMRTVEPVSMALVTVNIAPCIACGGRWFPSGELAKIEDVVDLRFVELRHIPVDAVQRVPLTCPQCPGTPPLEKVENAREKNVVMDACRHCNGIWLDRGELEAIQQESLPVAILNLFRWLRENRGSY